MNQFTQKIIKLFAHDLPMNLDSEIPVYLKLDSLSRFICHKFKATSVSILLYSGKEDRLNCRGRYINSNFIETLEAKNQHIRKILENICIYSYIYSAKKSKSKIKPVDDLYKELKSSVLASSFLNEEKFYNVYGKYEKWKAYYKKYVKTITNEYYYIGDTKTLTGELYKKILYEEPKYKINHYLEDLNTHPEKKFYCLKALKHELGLSLDIKYYLALPLFANNHYFGILRMLLSKEHIIIEKKEPSSFSLKEAFKNELEYLAQIVSLHLENYYILEGYKKTYFSSKKHSEQFSSIRKFLDFQCERLSEIIESKGAVIRLWNNERKKTEVAGHSVNLNNYTDYISTSGKQYFKELIKKLQKEKNIMGVTFDTTTPSNITKYIVHEDKDFFYYDSEKWDFQNSLKEDLPNKLEKKNIYNIAIMPIPNVEKSYIAFLNSKNRKFLSKDIEMIYPAIKNLGLELESHYYTQRIQNQMNVISKMHEEISEEISKEDIDGEEYVKIFLKVIGDTIMRLDIFSHHIAWEYISEEVPDDFKRDDIFFFRNITHKDFDEVPFRFGKHIFQPRMRSIFKIKDKEKKNKWNYNKYFSKNYTNQNYESKKIMELNLKEGYSFLDVPFYNYKKAENETPRLVGIFSLIYEKKYQSIVEEADFLNFIQFFSKQITIAWENLEECIANSIQKKILHSIRTNRKNGGTSRNLDLNKIADILANGFSCDLCTFFLSNEKINTLELSGSSLPINKRISYSIDDEKELLSVKSFVNNKNYRIFGRERVEEILKSNKLELIEEEVKYEILKKKNTKRQENVNYSNKDVLTEHWQSQVISVGDAKLGLIKLYQFKTIHINNDKKRFQYDRHPFSEFEINLLQRIQTHIFKLLITRKTIQQRIEDMRDVLHQVVAPLNAMIDQCTNLQENKVPSNKLNDKYTYLKMQAKQAVKYTRNFQRILDLDKGNITLKKEKINDLRQYLINKAIDYQSMAREEKSITINVIGEGREKISIEIDTDLFDHVINNLLDNAVKYSFDRDERLEMDIKEPEKPEDPGNIALNTRIKEDEILITISNWGIEIPKDERDKIFNREFRGSKARDFVPSGTGIGLFLAKEIVEMHGAILKLSTDTPKYNTIFKIKFPKEES